MSATERPRWVVAAVFALVAMIVWTGVVKYLVPILWNLSAGTASATGAGRAAILWDFWPLAHAALALLLWRGGRRLYEIAVALAAAEIAVVATKFALFSRAPEWSFWKLLWFSNKIYVLAFFIALLAMLLGPGRRDFDRERRARWAND
jgi:hypothetical protein